MNWAATGLTEFVLAGVVLVCGLCVIAVMVANA